MKANFFSIIVFIFLFSFCCISIESTEVTDFHVINGNSYYSKIDWISTLNYQGANLHNIEFKDGGIPTIGVKFYNQEYPFTFDFGNSDMIVITTELKYKIVYSLTGEDFLNYDGSVNPNIFYIKVPEVEIFGKKHTDVKAVLEPWERFSSHPFNGMTSMNYLNNYRFTLDYKRQLLAITSKSFPYNTSSNHYSFIDLIKIRHHTNKIFFIGKMNGNNALIYFDTGTNKTLVNRAFITADKISSSIRGDFYDGIIELQFNDIKIGIENPIVRNIGASIKYDYPLGITVGSDVLKYFILTVDRTCNNNKLIIHK